MDYQFILEEACNAVNETSVFLKKHFGKIHDGQIIEKEKNSLVSFVDKGAEAMLVDQLGNIIKDAGFITEEDTVDVSEREYTWIIDPLDGTTNYLCNIPFFSISVALYKGEKAVIGIVLEVISGELFTAIVGQGARLNGDRITVNTKANISDVLVATGFPYANHYDNDCIFTAIRYALENTRGLRRFGTAAMDLCYTACGRYGVYYEGYLNPWDIAAGALIVKEAGGHVSDFKGTASYHDGKNILACAPQFSEQMLEVLATWK